MTDVDCDSEDCVYYRVESLEKDAESGCLLAVLRIRDGRCADYKRKKVDQSQLGG